jgi:hypothetical protein
MPHNLPVSNKRHSKENSCVSLGAGWFTIFGRLIGDLVVKISTKTQTLDSQHGNSLLNIIPISPDLQIGMVGPPKENSFVRPNVH